MKNINKQHVVHETTMAQVKESLQLEIDEYISKAKEQSYKQVLDLGSKGVNALMQTAIKNLNPASLMTSMSSPTINKWEEDHQDSSDGSGVRRSLSADFANDETVSEDEEMDFYENTKSKTKLIKISKSKPKSGTRKSSRKTAAVNYYDISD